MSVSEVEKLVEQIKLNRGKGLYFVEGLSSDFARAIAKEVGVICTAREKDGQLEVATITSYNGGSDDSQMEKIINLFSELESEGECKVVNGEDVYSLDLQRGYELVLDKDSYIQQMLPILADYDLLERFKAGGTK